MDFGFLDYIWRGLTVGSLSSLTVLSGLLLTSFLINKKATRRQMKYFLHLQVLLVSLVFVASFIWVVCVDPELASGCFSAFAKDHSFFTLTRLFAAMWVMGLSGLLVFDLFRIFLFNSSSPQAPPSSELSTRFDLLAQKLGISSSVRLYISSDAISPHAQGMFKYSVVLPRAALTLSAQRLQHILAHELIHVRDKDSAWKILELFGRRILFFNPLMYLLARRHLMTMEMAADEGAIALTQDTAKDYIQTLLEVIGLQRTALGHPLALNASRTFKETKERMEALARQPGPESPSKWIHGMTFGAVLISVGFSVAQARSTVQESVKRNLETGMMCTQVHHEKWMESWLPIPAEKNQCKE